MREAILRRPLGLTISAEELADDETRQHFCALSLGRVVGSVSLKPLGEALLQLKQMAVAEDRQRRGIGRQLLAHAEGWARGDGLPPHGAQRQARRRGLLRGSAIVRKASRSRRTRAACPMTKRLVREAILLEGGNNLCDLRFSFMLGAWLCLRFLCGLAPSPALGAKIDLVVSARYRSHSCLRQGYRLLADMPVRLRI